ncbi:hypothetical protein C8R43DRAFT_951432 [Mycena crocata]|nr:hypothetical protein C8R43DRAFT_951432 [Mycena crocata]
MPVHRNKVDFNTVGPPGSREGSGEVVHPSRECLLAASSEDEISRSQGTQGPIPGYHNSGPFCDGSVALAVTDQSEEQQVDTSPNISALTEHLPHGREVLTNRLMYIWVMSRCSTRIQHQLLKIRNLAHPPALWTIRRPLTGNRKL